jgi:hypothetical protein
MRRGRLTLIGIRSTIGQCRLRRHPHSTVNCAGLRAGASITVPGGFGAEEVVGVTPTPSIPVPPELPTPERLDIADHQLSCFISELAHFLNVLEHAGDPMGGEPKTAEEYLEREEAGDTFEPQQLDRARLAEIVVLASEWIVDADIITETAEKIRHEALTLYREQLPTEELYDHYRRVREWHLAEAGEES